VHAGPVDTDMASELTLPKVKPVDVVRQVLSAVEVGRDEVLADDMTRQVKAGLSDQEGIYLNFDPDRCSGSEVSRAQFSANERRTVMPRVTVGEENSSDIQLYYEDHGYSMQLVYCPHESEPLASKSHLSFRAKREIVA
jgi:hypothetical protein